MSSASSPPSLVSLSHHSEDSRDSGSLELDPSSYQQVQTSDYKSHAVTSHNVEDILSENSTYNTQENVMSEVRNPSMSLIGNSFDYNSRDSAGFSIQDILGLPQAYNQTTTQEDVEPRYDYQIANYDNISNSSNNYLTGVDEVSSDGCVGKSETLYHNGAQRDNEIVYNTNYAVNDPVHTHQRHNFDGDIATEPGSGFSTQVMPFQSKSSLIVVGLQLYVHCN